MTTNNKPAIKSAGNAMLAITGCYSIIIGVVLAVSSGGRTDKTGVGIMVIYGLALWLGTIFVYQKKKAGFYLSLLAAIPVLFAFPIGTVLAGYAYYYLFKANGNKEFFGQATDVSLQ